jgi:16S rRNA (cytosine967-C5)-methyltransferase
MHKEKRQHRKADARSGAFHILKKFILEKNRLDDLIDQVLQQNRLNDRSRRMLRNLTSGVTRHLLYLDWLAGRLFQGNYPKALVKEKVILYLGLYELIYLKGIPARAAVYEYVELAKLQLGESFAKRINAILQSYLREKDALLPEKLIEDPAELISVRHSFPLWLVKRWIELWGEAETVQLCRAMNIPPEFDLTIHENKIGVREFHALLTRNDIEFRASERQPNVVVTSDMQAIIRLKLLDNGYCSAQDESTAIPVEQLQVHNAGPILDVCAAPGGKYIRILQESGGQSVIAVAMDIDLNRLRLVKANVRRLGLSGGRFVVADGRRLPFRPVFARALVDAPCSGLGVIRKHPDIKWRRAMYDMAEFSQLQSAILSSAATVIKEGGRLAYSTCTIDPLENENVAGSFAEAHQDQFQIVTDLAVSDTERAGKFIRTFPHRHHTDGSFCAVFQKRKKESC